MPRLPFEMACLPQSWYRFARMPVVSYALPALIAIGQVVHHHRSTWNPITWVLRRLGKRRSLRVLERIQPSSGGFLEATPLTSFVVMSLAAVASRAPLRKASASRLHGGAGELGRSAPLRKASASRLHGSAESTPADRVIGRGVDFIINSRDRMVAGRLIRTCRSG